LETNKPALIVSDVMMPGMSGFELYEHLLHSDQWSRIPFIFLTAKSQRPDIRRGMELGADDYLVKPFEPEELIRAVQIRLERAAQTQAAIDEAATDLKNSIVQTLTHEFRTPLSLVVGYTELLEETGQEMNQQSFQKTLQGLHQGAQRLTTLIEDFLILTRLNSGSLVQEIQSMPLVTPDPDRTVEQVVTEFREGLDPERVSFSLELGGQGLAITAANQHLADMLRRLISNAVKFSNKTESQIRVTTRQDGGFWSVAIADNGIGISREMQPTIFESFRQVDRRRREQQGSGVGLTIVRGLVEAYRGRIAVQSEAGQGATFTIWLPRAD
jgi:signal transduction histidine kinase